MDSTNKLSVGIDLGDRVSEACVVRAGAVVERFKVPMLRDAFVLAFGERERCVVALEAGTQCAWVAATLKGLGFDVVVANSRKLAAISTNTRKNDRNDAEMLARLVGVDRSLLSPVKLRGDAEQRVLEQLGARHTLVRMRTQLINNVRSRCKGIGVRLKSTDAASFEGLELTVPEVLRPSTVSLFRMIREINTEIAQHDGELAAIAKRDYPATVGLQRVKGVGPVTSLAFVLVLGQHDRFPNGRYAAAYLGLVPRQDQSGKGDRQLGISKAGNTYLRALLVQCSQSILGRNGVDCDLRRWGHGIAERGGKNAKKRAIVATARKLAVLLFGLWKRGDTWNPLHNAAAKPPVSTTPVEGCPDVPVLDDCARVLDQPGRPTDCSVDRGPDPNVHRARTGPSSSADRSMGRGASSTGTATPARHKSQRVKGRSGGDPACPADATSEQKSASRAFGKELATNLLLVTPSPAHRPTQVPPEKRKKARGGTVVP